MTKREGVLVGGPKAGQFYAGQGSYIRFATLPRTPIMPFDKMAEVASRPVDLTHVTYVWSELFNCWVLEELVHAGPDATIRELLDHYRPLATDV